MEEQLLTAIKEGGESKWKILDRLKVVRLMDVLGRTSLQDLRTPSGIHVLNYAILNYNFVAARMLLKKGVSPSSADKNGRTALHAAATVDDAGILVDIMKEYDDVNVKDDEGEEAWGPVVQYRTLQSCSANLVFPLCDVPEEWEQLVLRLLAEAGLKHDIVVKVDECIPWWYRSSKPVRGAGEKVGQGITVAKAEVSVTLDPAGSMLLMSRPLQQAVVLEPGKTEVTSVANENVKLQAPEDFSGKIEGNLHVCELRR
nr:hypothetical protein BaRGS_030747 [Batillaria attramentaria]